MLINVPLLLFIIIVAPVSDLLSVTTSFIDCVLVVDEATDDRGRYIAVNSCDLFLDGWGTY
jgi:hypothetical protein